jgi:hypothetical protein
MKKALLLSLGLLALAPGVARAGLDLTWRAGNTAGGDSVITLDCANPDSAAVLYGCFQVPDTVEHFIGMVIGLDIQTESRDLPPFWRLEREGCNRPGVVFSNAWPEQGVKGAVNLWGGSGETVAAIAAYGPAYGGPNRGRLICVSVFSADNRVRLEPGKNYFAFRLNILNDLAKEAGGSCEGCGVPVSITWSYAWLSRLPLNPADTPPRDLLVDGPGLRSQCARANGARPGPCQALPPQPQVFPADSTGAEASPADSTGAAASPADSTGARASPADSTRTKRK